MLSANALTDTLGSLSYSDVPTIAVQLLKLFWGGFSLNKGVKPLIGNNPVKCRVDNSGRQKAVEIVHVIKLDRTVADSNGRVNSGDKARKTWSDTNNPLFLLSAAC